MDPCAQVENHESSGQTLYSTSYESPVKRVCLSIKSSPDGVREACITSSQSVPLADTVSVTSQTKPSPNIIIVRPVSPENIILVANKPLDEDQPNDLLSTTSKYNIKLVSRKKN